MSCPRLIPATAFPAAEAAAAIAARAAKCAVWKDAASSDPRNDPKNA
jgi:hypothetical protein